MAFDILLQQNNSEEIRVDKDLTTVATFSGELKDASSIIDPVILIECSMADARKSNYMTIEAFGRSYFIRNIRSVRRNLIEFTCHVDVLSSFKAGIRGSRAIVRRQENDNNTLLNDGYFKTTQNPHIVVYTFKDGFTTQEFVLALAGS